MEDTRLSIWKQRRLRQLTGVLLVPGFIIIAAVHLIGRPVHGSSVRVDKQLLAEVHVPKNQSPAPTATAAEGNQYFSLNLPSGFMLQAGSTTVPGLLYQQTIRKPSVFGSLIISVALKNLPEGGLNADTAYSSRQQEPAHYRFSEQKLGDDTVCVANDTQAAGLVAFWPHGRYLVSISLASGVDTAGDLDNQAETSALQQLLRGWQWHS